MTETRTETAQRLVDEGKVHIVRIEHYFTEGTVRADQKRYLVMVYDTGRFFCTCDWGAYHNYTNDLCAHALAVKLAVEKENKP